MHLSHFETKHDQWISRQTDMPSRPEAIRRLILIETMADTPARPASHFAFCAGRSASGSKHCSSVWNRARGKQAAISDRGQDRHRSDTLQRVAESRISAVKCVRVRQAAAEDQSVSPLVTIRGDCNGPASIVRRGSQFFLCNGCIDEMHQRSNAIIARET
jgi:hypothetical protein